MQVINIMGPPGAGKSTVASGLFWLMKQMQLDVELITEFTKDLIYEGSTFVLGNELLVFSEKYRRIRRLEGVDYVITDSPLINSIFYSNDFGDTAQAFYRSVAESFDNIYVLLNRTADYVEKGRQQSAAESDRISDVMRGWLQESGTPYLEIDGDSSAPWRILKHHDFAQLSLPLEGAVSYDRLLTGIRPQSYS